jgi:hypothetical protein
MTSNKRDRRKYVNKRRREGVFMEFHLFRSAPGVPGAEVNGELVVAVGVAEQGFRNDGVSKTGQ